MNADKIKSFSIQSHLIELMEKYQVEPVVLGTISTELTTLDEIDFPLRMGKKSLKNKLHIFGISYKDGHGASIIALEYLRIGSLINTVEITVFKDKKPPAFWALEVDVSVPLKSKKTAGILTRTDTKDSRIDTWVPETYQDILDAKNKSEKPLSKTLLEASNQHEKKFNWVKITL